MNGHVAMYKYLLAKSDERPVGGTLAEGNTEVAVGAPSQTNDVPVISDDEGSLGSSSSGGGIELDDLMEDLMDRHIDAVDWFERSAMCGYLEMVQFIYEKHLERKNKKGKSP
eukprot:GFYU01073496.1.p1 GENE.GFYU01073496.1~~GFYU01073496.1.p1  ORF type:complete len:112 (-),score=23.38 GFYU01073496.1:14-349(-)